MLHKSSWCGDDDIGVGSQAFILTFEAVTTDNNSMDQVHILGELLKNSSSLIRRHEIPVKKSDLLGEPILW